MPPDWVERKLAAILFTDIVGSTALMAESEQKGLGVRERHRALVSPAIEQYRGESIEAKGDETLSVFGSALDAVNCALAIQGELADDPELKLHIGIHLSDILLRPGEISGDGVNIAARICALSDGDATYVSAEVHQAVRNQPHLTATALGEHEFKNVGRPVAVFRVTGEAGVPSPARPRPAPATGEIRSLAVLPLENLSGDPEQEYFADGMTDTLIGDLAKIGGLSVISRTSVMHYKGQRKPLLKEIARELNVEGILEGTVMRAGDRVRISTQLIDARTDQHIWSERYDRELSDVLALQSDVARAVAEQVRLELTPDEQAVLTVSRKVDPRAFDAYLRGLQIMDKGPSNIRAWGPQAIEQFERAVELDPDFAEAWSMLAGARALLSNLSFDLSYRNELAKAREAAQRALEIDDRLGQAHTLLGFVQDKGSK